jgi:hypothetical protein
MINMSDTMTTSGHNKDTNNRKRRSNTTYFSSFLNNINDTGLYMPHCQRVWLLLNTKITYSNWCKDQVRRWDTLFNNLLYVTVRSSYHVTTSNVRMIGILDNPNSNKIFKAYRDFGNSREYDALPATYKAYSTKTITYIPSVNRYVHSLIIDEIVLHIRRMLYLIIKTNIDDNIDLYLYSFLLKIAGIIWISDLISYIFTILTPSEAKQFKYICNSLKRRFVFGASDNDRRYALNTRHFENIYALYGLEKFTCDNLEDFNKYYQYYRRPENTNRSVVDKKFVIRRIPINNQHNNIVTQTTEPIQVIELVQVIEPVQTAEAVQPAEIILDKPPGFEQPYTGLNRFGITSTTPGFEGLFTSTNIDINNIWI